MRFKLDENFGKRTLNIFQAAGHDVQTTLDEGMQGCSDRHLYDVCCKERRCLVTLDLDFSDVTRFPPEQGSGIAVIRVPRNPSLAGPSVKCSMMSLCFSLDRFCLSDDDGPRLAKSYCRNQSTRREAMSDISKMAGAEFIGLQKLDELSLQAQQSPRKRINYNLHHSDEAACHRLLNAMEPDSYIQPHRHLEKDKDETLIVLRGEMGLILFDEQGNIEGKALLGPARDRMVVNIPHGTFHAWISLEERSVFFEAKAGPYRPLTRSEKAAWAPGEGEESSAAYLASLKRLFEPGEGP